MKIIMLISISLAFACSKKTEETKVIEKESSAEVKKEAAKTIKKADSPEVKKTDPKGTEKVEKQEDVKSLPFLKLKYSKKDRPATVKFSGTAKHGLRWQDKNGENWLILSESLKTVDHHGTTHTEAQNLYATHVAIKDNDVKVLRTIKEIKPECEFDWMASFESRAISILDLDKDGYGEVTFSYRTNCTSDVSPSTYKLIVLENGEKNIFRGTDILKEKKYRQPGDGTFKSEGFKGNKVLLDHAKSVWKKTAISKD